MTAMALDDGGMERKTHRNNVIQYYLNGEGPLWKLFWLWGVLLSWILLGLFYLATNAIGITWGLFLISGVIMLPYSIWLLVSIWMCAENTGHDFWGRAARFLTLIWSLNIGAVAGYLLTELVIGWG